jgi:GNAT superfamily N-acetyltransferase
MIIREAGISDIEKMQEIRNSVRENVLSDPARITYHDYKEYIMNRGRGWVCELDEEIRGFAVIDTADLNIWALFVQPGFEKKGIGKKLHDHMLDWYFINHDQTLWLSTAPQTRAENFYRKAGWKETGLYGKGEIRFEMTFEDWKDHP